MKFNLRLLNLLLASLAAVLFSIPIALAAFDPVNDDTDIFLANPNNPSQRPNILIILDNTANWGQPFNNEKAALIRVVDSLDERFNVGLMMMSQTGNGNDTVDGGYVRFGIRQMTGANRAALKTMVANLDEGNDRSNGNKLGMTMYEAFLYFAGRPSRASFGKVKTDFTGNTAANNPASALPGNALPANPSSTTLFNSPITDLCQKNFIIYISNGPANENSNALAQTEAALTALNGPTPVIRLRDAPSQEGNWADEFAAYMAENDVNTNLAGKQTVVTYTIEVNPNLTGTQGPGMTALLRSMADNGKGGYFGVTSDASGVAIADAFSTILDEVQAVNSVFAATTLPVSVNVRGTNLNQVYIGVFRPDADKAPRWLGNLKLYNLVNIDNRVALGDASNGLPPATGIAALNETSGLVKPGASSFWTASSTFWGYRKAAENGSGGASDKPDGDLVEKGGVAQQLRIAYAAAEAASPLRNLYTCTTGSYTNQCLPSTVSTLGSTLSSTPFSEANTDISAGTLQLDARAISPLSAYVPQSITNLTDRRSVTLDNGGSGSSTISSLSNGGTTLAVNALSTDLVRTISTLTATQQGTDASTATGRITKVGSGSNAVCTVTFGSSLSATQFVTNARVSLASFAGSDQNSATVTITGRPSGTSFTYACGSGNGQPSTVGTNTGTATVMTYPSDKAIATTSSNHGFSTGETVVVSGASPTVYNTTGAAITVTAANQFTYLISSVQNGAATGSAITASGISNAARGTTVAAHGITNGSTANVVILNAVPAAYNCPTGCTITSTGANTFTYTLATAVGPATTFPVIVRNGSTTVTATTTTAHAFTAGMTVNIQNAVPAGYNGSFTVLSSPAPTSPTFAYTTGSIQPSTTGAATITASVSTSATVIATLANHGFSSGDAVVIESTGSPADTNHPGTYTITPLTTNTFSYVTGTAKPAPSGTYTVRPVNSRAYVTLPNHGYATNDEIRIEGAAPAGYNGVKSPITFVDANTFSYSLGTTSVLGANTANGVIASKKSTTARATSVAHGFADNSTVQITGASPAAFNGTFTITYVDADRFTYALTSGPQGDATGAAFATQSGGSGRDALIRWVRGEDNFVNENKNTGASASTDIRASVHGDVLHSRPAVINYNRYGSDNDVYVFYGANDGVFRAVKGGFATDGSAANQILPGNEAWGFIPPEFFDRLGRLRRNGPIISSSFKKPYFADGSIGVYTRDADGDGKLGGTNDKANLYITMRRGGRLIYALDVNNPHAPRFLWKIDSSTTGFGELGQTWSNPTVVRGLAGYPDPVLVFGAGYDPEVEDIVPTSITSYTPTTVTTGTGASTITRTRTMGRGIYVVNALTGELLWRALGSGTASANTRIVTGMNYAIPSDVTLIRNETGGATNRAYVGDTGGNVWRVDFRYDATNGWSNSQVTQLASIGGPATVTAATASDISKMRKFLSAPSVVGFPGFDAVLLGSGDREHPFDSAITNRYYMFKDQGSDVGPLTGTTGATGANPYIVEGTLFDATSNCIQDATGCTSGTPEDARTLLSSATGWYLTMGAGEKVTSSSVSLAGTTFFNTNQPSTTASGEECGPNLGVARQYQISPADATATNKRGDNILTTSDRSTRAEGGGYLPAPVHVVVNIDGKTEEVVISGLQVDKSAGPSLNSRLRKYWYKEID